MQKSGTILRHLVLPALAVLFSGTFAAAQLSSGSPYRLIGTIKSPGFAGAVLDDSTGKQEFYRIQEPLADGSRIVRVRNDSILVKKSDGSSYELFIVHHQTKPSGRPAAGARARVPAVPPRTYNRHIPMPNRRVPPRPGRRAR